jgi:hypothetical protein
VTDAQSAELHSRFLLVVPKCCLGKALSSVALKGLLKGVEVVGCQNSVKVALHPPRGCASIAEMLHYATVAAQPTAD